MANVKVEVTGAYVDGNAPGTTISIDSKSAEQLEAIGYVRKVKAEAKKEAEEKPSSKTKAKKQTSKK